MARLKWRRALSPRKRRHVRVRAKVNAQVIDDTAGHTLASASDLEADVKAIAGEGATKSARAKAVGQVIAERTKAAGYTAVVFDRGGFLYHGRVKAVADGARESGLNF